jgi:hypothetical protein
MATYGIEVVRHVYDEEHGHKLTVGPDCDGLGLLEIDGGDEYGRLVFSPGHAKYLANAIAKCAAEMDQAE